MSDLPEKPVTRKEMYLSAIAGENTTIPDPAITREEMYLKYIAEHGGGGTVDAYTKDESDARYLQKSGGALTGQITTNQTEFTVSNQLISKGYVDSAIAAITDYETEVFPNG